MSRLRWFPSLAWCRVLGIGLAAALVGACESPTEPREPPYIAIVSIFTSDGGTDLGREYTYRVTEISGRLGIDEIIHAAPHDTIIVPVKPATYRVTLEGVPSYCRLPGNGSSEYYILIPEGTNTAIVRYQLSCESQLTLTTAADGTNPDQSFIYRLTGPGGERTGIVGGADTLRFDDLELGTYEVELVHVAPHCVVTNGEGAKPRVTVVTEGGGRVDFRVFCSDEARRPRLLSFTSSYHDRTSGFMFRAVDPDGDIERYFWDITDCEGRSVLPAGGRQRRGLLQAHLAGLDTITVFGAIEPGLPDSVFAPGRCTSIRVADQYGNSTPVFEEPIGNETAAGPTQSLFNARFLTVAQLQTQLQVSNPNYAGVFAAALLRDGILFPADGEPDLGVYNAVGYEGAVLPVVPLGGGRPEYYDYYAVVVYLFDQDGNFTRLTDDDLFN